VLERRQASAPGRLLIACPITPRISNFDDLDPLKLEPEVELAMIPPGRPIPAEAALIVLPGSKATIADLAAIRREGWDLDILSHHRRGGAVLGLCGGYQMLGRRIADPDGIEGEPADVAGLGLLDVETVLGGDKALRRVSGAALGAACDGYEMHIGTTTGPDTARPLVRLADGRSDGAASTDGLVFGTYLHGLLSDPRQRAAWIARLGGSGGGADYRASVDAALDGIAAQLERHVDIDAIIALSAQAGAGE
jgi:adenosylcobyric acid synthase